MCNGFTEHNRPPVVCHRAQWPRVLLPRSGRPWAGNHREARNYSGRPFMRCCKDSSKQKLANIGGRHCLLQVYRTIF